MKPYSPNILGVRPLQAVSPGSPHLFSGFTLIEVLVVLVILSMVLTLAIPRLFQPNPQDILEEEALRLGRKIELAGQEAILSSREIGLSIEPDHYQFMYFEEEKWSPLEHDILDRYKLHDDLEMILTLEGAKLNLGSEEQKNAPQVLILSSGEYTPFDVTFQNRNFGSGKVTLTINTLGERKISYGE